ncbi:baseplate wedge subunit [Yersinia phage vB_YenM_P778]
MAMTSTGLETQRYQDILDRIQNRLFAEISPDLDLSSDSAIGIILGTITDRISEVYEITSEVYDSGVITKAEGFSLDDLTALNDIYRNLARPTSGFVEVTGDSGANIDPSVRMRTTAGDIFNTNGTYTLSPSQCIEATVKVNQLIEGIEYTIILNNVVYTYTTKVGDTPLMVLNAFSTEINGGLVAKADVDTKEETLRIYKDLGDIQKRQQSMTVSATSYLTFTKITINAIVNSAEVGAIGGLAGTLNTLDSFPSGIDSIYNRYDLTEGRDTETDTELRKRYLSGLDVTGAGTLAAIVAAVRRTLGVSDALIIENDTETTSVAGIPAKSFEVIAVGGDDNDVAQAIWDTKPVGIRAYGTSAGEATDYAGNKHTVHFQRPTPKYVFVKLTYAIYDEEALNIPTSNLNDTIKTSITEYGDTLGVGKDVIPNRILSYVYKNIQGIEVTSVKCALAENQQTPPLDPAYTSDKITVESGEYTVWESNQYTLTEV